MIFFLCVIVVLLAFGLSSALLRHGDVRHLVVAFYQYEGNSDRQDI